MLSSSTLPSVDLVDADEFDVEDEGGVGRDASGHALGAVAHVGGDGELGALADGHVAEALLPSGDDLEKD